MAEVSRPSRPAHRGWRLLVTSKESEQSALNDENAATDTTDRPRLLS
jgi:hypothetical protein